MTGKTVAIVLNYNDYLQTIQFVKHIEKYASIHYIIVVDNGSLNNSLEGRRGTNSVSTEFM